MPNHNLHAPRNDKAFEGRPAPGAGDLPLAHQPGERWLYHMGSEILGVLIARASGKPLAAFLRERIFEPLGMVDTGFHLPAAKLDRLAACYLTDFLTGAIVAMDDASAGDVARPPAFESGGGGLVSTADDLLAFGQMMLSKGAYGRERILSRPTVELMITDHITREQKAASPFFENFWEARGWGFGVSVITARTEVAGVPGRFGWDGAFGTSWYVDPREEMVGVLMTQCRPGLLALPAVVLDFWTSAYQLIESRARHRRPTFRAFPGGRRGPWPAFRKVLARRRCPRPIFRKIPAGRRCPRRTVRKGGRARGA